MLEFNRGGWSVEAFGSASRRSDWELWGSPLSSPDLEGSRQGDYDPDQEDFLQYGATVAKQFFLPYFQKIRVEGYVAAEHLTKLMNEEN